MKRPPATMSHGSSTIPVNVQSHSKEIVFACFPVTELHEAALEHSPNGLLSHAVLVCLLVSTVPGPVHLSHDTFQENRWWLAC